MFPCLFVVISIMRDARLRVIYLPLCQPFIYDSSWIWTVLRIKCMVTSSLLSSTLALLDSHNYIMPGIMLFQNYVIPRIMLFQEIQLLLLNSCHPWFSTFMTHLEYEHNSTDKMISQFKISWISMTLLKLSEFHQLPPLCQSLHQDLELHLL